jgi:hypothetical protein
VIDRTPVAPGLRRPPGAAFRVCSRQPRRALAFDAPWFVVRLSDDRVMSQGDVVQCVRWVKVWGPVRRSGP